MPTTRPPDSPIPIGSGSGHHLSPENTFENTVRMFDQLAMEYLNVIDQNGHLGNVSLLRSHLLRSLLRIGR